MCYRPPGRAPAGELLRGFSTIFNSRIIGSSHPFESFGRFFDSCPWVGFVVYLGQVLEVKVCIHLGGADIGVAEELLDGAQVMTRFQQVGGK